MTGMNVARELPDFEPSTGHEHGCSGHDCSCAGHLYAIAQDAEHALADREARLAAVEALADEWDANLRREFGLSDDDPKWTDWHSRELRAVLHPDPSEAKSEDPCFCRAVPNIGNTPCGRPGCPRDFTAQGGGER